MKTIIVVLAFALISFSSFAGTIQHETCKITNSAEFLFTEVLTAHGFDVVKADSKVKNVMDFSVHLTKVTTGLGSPRAVDSNGEYVHKDEVTTWKYTDTYQIVGTLNMSTSKQINANTFQQNVNFSMIYALTVEELIDRIPYCEKL